MFGKLIGKFRYEVLIHQLSLRPMSAQERDFMLGMLRRMSDERTAMKLQIRAQDEEQAANPGAGLWIKPADTERLERIFDKADGALPQDAGGLLNLIREIEAERKGPKRPPPDRLTRRGLL